MTFVAILLEKGDEGIFKHFFSSRPKINGYHWVR